MSISNKEYLILNRLNGLPKKMLQHHECENIADLVLHELCHHCFDINKAAYFVDNPDFDCLKGVAGYCKDDVCKVPQDVWQNPQDFSHQLAASPFNQRVRNFQRASVKKEPRPDEEIVEDIARELQMGEHGYYSWNMKHDNHGIFVFEKNGIFPIHDERIVNALSLLGFCPIA